MIRTIDNSFAAHAAPIGTDPYRHRSVKGGGTG